MKSVKVRARQNAPKGGRFDKSQRDSTTAEKQSKLSIYFNRGVLVAVTMFFLAVTIRWNLSINGAEHFASLARSFTHGELNFREPPDGSWADTTPHEGKYYWPLGPLPSVVLLPFTFLADAAGTTFYQGYLQPFLVGALLALVYVCARRVGYGPED